MTPSFPSPTPYWVPRFVIPRYDAESMNTGKGTRKIHFPLWLHAGPRIGVRGDEYVSLAFPTLDPAVLSFRATTRNP